MKVSILTLFPDMFTGPFDHSILKRAQEKGLLELECINIRDFGEGKHQVIDDKPYGGGIGMVMRVDILHKAIEYAKKKVSRVSEVSKVSKALNQEHKALDTPDTLDTPATSQKVILLSATGKTFKQQTAQSFAELDHLILICGHYEGVDERVKHYIDEEISIGDFILTGGELPAMLIVDAVTRLIPGVITEGATTDESFSEHDGQQYLEYPHYTKPRIYENQEVPEVLLSGDHKKIHEWRRNQAKMITKKLRPDLLKKSE